MVASWQKKKYIHLGQNINVEVAEYVWFIEKLSAKYWSSAKFIFENKSNNVVMFLLLFRDYQKYNFA